MSSCLLNASYLLTVCCVSDLVLSRSFMSVFLFNLNPVCKMVAFLWAGKETKAPESGAAYPSSSATEKKV